MENYDDYEDFDEVVSFDELKKEVNEEYSSMRDEELYMRTITNDPTFCQFVLSFMSINKLKKLLINRYTYKYKIIQ